MGRHSCQRPNVTLTWGLNTFAITRSRSSHIKLTQPSEKAPGAAPRAPEAGDSLAAAAPAQATGPAPAIFQAARCMRLRVPAPTSATLIDRGARDPFKGEGVHDQLTHGHQLPAQQDGAGGVGSGAPAQADGNRETIYICFFPPPPLYITIRNGRDSFSFRNSYGGFLLLVAMDKRRANLRMRSLLKNRSLQL